MDEVIVKQTGKYSLSARQGIVTQYLPGDYRKAGALTVYLATCKVKSPSC